MSNTRMYNHADHKRKANKCVEGEEIIRIAKKFAAAWKKIEKSRVCKKKGSQPLSGRSDDPDPRKKKKTVVNKKCGKLTRNKGQDYFGLDVVKWIFNT